MALYKMMLLAMLGVTAAYTGVTRGQTAAPASLSAYPNKPIRILTTQPGSGFDLVTRLIAEGLTTAWGQQVIVDNRGGAGGIIAGDIVAKAVPDGYTLLSYGPAMWLVQYMRKNVPFDPLKDFAPITLAITAPNVLVVHPSVAARSVKDLIGVAKAKPGTLNYGGGNTGSSAHLAAILFNSMAGVNIVHVPYKSAGQALTALLAGEVQLMFPNAATASPHLKSGKLRALAVTSAAPSALLPELPTVAASGVPGYEAVVIMGVFAPANTPAVLVSRLNQEIARILAKKEMKDTLQNAGTTGVGSKPEQLTAAIKADMANLGKVIRDAGIRED